MANIRELLNNVKYAIFGKEVRQSIHDAIEECYNAASVEHDNANMEVKLSRGTYSTLDARLTATDKDVSKNIQKINEIANMGTTVETIEKATKEEIQKQIDNGKIANLTIENGTVTHEKLSQDMFKTSIGTGVQAIFPNGQSYENSYPVKLDFEIPSGININDIQATVNFYTESENLSKVRLKVVIGKDSTNQSNIKSGDYVGVLPGESINVPFNWDCNHIGYDNVSLYVFPFGDNYTLPANYSINNIKLKINGELISSFKIDSSYATNATHARFEYIQSNKIATLIDLEEATSNSAYFTSSNSMATFSNGQEFEKSYPLLYKAPISTTCSKVRVEAEITPRSSNLIRGRLKFVFNGQTSANVVLGGYFNLKKNVTTKLTMDHLIVNPTSIAVYLYIEGIDHSLPSSYNFTVPKLLIDDEYHEVKFIRDTNYLTHLMDISIEEGRGELIDKNGNVLELSILNRIEELENRESTSTSPLNGKTFNIIGDSYVFGHTLGVTKTWSSKLANKYNMVYRNYGINGNGLVTTNGSGTPVITRYTEMNDNADYIGVVGGKNDYNQQIPLDEFKAGLHTLCQGLIKKYLGKKIFFGTPWSIPDEPSRPIKLIEYTDAIKEVCGIYSIPVFDSSRMSGICMVIPEFRDKFCLSNSDVSHLNELGMDFVMPKYESFMNSL